LKAIYVDEGYNYNNPASSFEGIVAEGYNYVLLAFLVSGQPYDAVQSWSTVSPSQQQSTISWFHSKNARLVVSAGGSTDTPYGSFSGTQYGTTAANWAVSQHLDGVDFDLENFGGSFTAAGMSTSATISWVADATNAARNILGPNGIISHAPQFPYFGNDDGFSNGYGQVYQQAPSINFLLIQYYNNGASDTYEEIFVSLSGGSISEISSQSGIPYSKLIPGKPVTSSDGNDYITASAFHSIVTQAQANLGWNAGVFGWQWHDNTTNYDWISTIYP